MRHEIDKYAKLQSPIHQREPRCKIVGLMTLILSFSFIEDLLILPATIFVTAILYKLSRLPYSYLIERLHYPGYFLLGVVLFLPFTIGDTVVLDLGILALRREGLLATVPIVVRFLCIVTVSLILFGTSPIATTLRTLRSLGIPSLITDMMFLFYRYVYEILDRLAQVQTAMRLRGFNSHQFSWRNFKVLVSLAGTLVVTSYEQSEQVYSAMRLRGYGQPSTRRARTRIRQQDAIALVGVLLLSMGFIAVQVWIARN
jgi:cobalt/nickel transport system permease protein